MGKTKGKTGATYILLVPSFNSFQLLRNGRHQLAPIIDTNVLNSLDSYIAEIK